MPRPPEPEQAEFEPCPIPPRLAGVARTALEKAPPPRGFRLREERIKKEKKVMRKPSLPFLPPREESRGGGGEEDGAGRRCHRSCRHAQRASCTKARSLRRSGRGSPGRKAGAFRQAGPGEARGNGARSCSWTALRATGSEVKSDPGWLPAARGTLGGRRLLPGSRRAGLRLSGRRNLPALLQTRGTLLYRSPRLMKSSPRP